jgi:ketosteroid isomerase-like protein
VIPSEGLVSRCFAGAPALVVFALFIAGAGCSPAAPAPCAPSDVTPAASGPGASPAQGGAASEEEKRIAAVLDDWHDAAAKADETRYFGHLTEDSVFLGTDATERWDKAAFQAYASPHFAKGKAWRFRAARRAIAVGAGGQVAWFDEDLVTEKLGPARGSGVLVRTGRGWQIAHYNLSIPIPNERFDAVRKIIAAPAGEPPAAAP